MKRSRVSLRTAIREIKLLLSVNFVKKNNTGWIFNPLFKYAKEFDRLLVNSDSLDKKIIIDSFKKIGRVKLLLLSGVFIKSEDSRVDLLIVGDRLKRNKIEEEIHKLEAEMGTELAYAIFDTKEFSYRLDMYDKLIRDILDFPHEVAFQAKELSTQTLKKP
jgi:hypothetical protein